MGKGVGTAGIRKGKLGEAGRKRHKTARGIQLIMSLITPRIHSRGHGEGKWARGKKDKLNGIKKEEYKSKERAVLKKWWTRSW